MALLAGRPLVAWSHATLQAFCQSLEGTSCRVFLSTDDPEIAEAWPTADRPQRLRPAELATDIASSLDVVLHEIAASRDEGFEPDTVLLLQPTSPLVTVDDLQSAWKAFKGGETPSVIGMTETDHPVQWTWAMDEFGTLLGKHDEQDGDQRQKLQPRHRPVGFYFVTTEFLMRERAFILPGITRGTRVPASHGIDIDSAQDLVVAKATLIASSPPPVVVGERKIGNREACFIIAEAGVNHNGDLNRALEMVEAAAEAGADAIKFQTFKSEALVTSHARKAKYQVTNTGGDGGQLEMLKKLELLRDELLVIKASCQKHGIIFLSSPFELESALLLKDIGVPAFKVGSGEITNLSFLESLAGYGIPLILSTGMCHLDEVEAAVAAVQAHGNPPLALLHCTSAYPAPPHTCNLRAMESLSMVFGVTVGYSDHTTGWDICLAAVAMGATIIEKHFTMDRTLPGPDHAASLEPGELKKMIQEIRRIESALGSGVKAPTPEELDTRLAARKSLAIARDLQAGCIILDEHLVAKRPGTGIPPSERHRLVGRTLNKSLVEDTLISWSDMDE